MWNPKASRVAFRTAVALALATAALTAAAFAGQEPAGQPAAMSPEEQKAMEAWAKAATPGPQHQQLAAMAGDWTVESTMWMSPEKPPEKSTGTAERTMILGGRVLKEKVSATMMGQPFEGLGLAGYDNVTGNWWGTWTDNLGTGVMLSSGTCSSDGKCESTGTFVDPMTGKEARMRMTSEHQPDHEVHRMYGAGPDGKEFLNMELHYTRVK
ncbi:MAG: DUF1579 domain-containing protein [Thermoanaerobaculia bacterium]|nr:MAG: DUF1579 domain-containing protein [Thermoanaerobaculia bacterium]